jgi:hypothetical protein
MLPPHKANDLANKSDVFSAQAGAHSGNRTAHSVASRARGSEAIEF